MDIKPLATSLRPTLSMALSKALPIKNSRERSATYQPGSGGCPEDLARTINTLLICKGLSLLRSVPFYHEPIPECEGSTGIRSTKLNQHLSNLDQSSDGFTYSSSQLNNDRARVVSIWRTVSFYALGQHRLAPSHCVWLTSNSSLVVNP